MSDDRPNVLVIHPHNLGRHLGSYGRGVDTPNLDGLAAAGARFESYFCTAAHCSPARASMWTGRYPHQHGLVGLAHLGWSLNDGETTLMERLRDAGYATHLVGVQHVADDPGDVGFEHVDGSGHEFTVDEPARDVAARAAERLRSGDLEDPFFMSVGFSEVHREPLVERCLDCGWTFDLPGYESADPDEVEGLPYLPDEPGVREDVAHFHGQVSAIDDAAGTVIDAVDDAGRREETLVVFTTDHGAGFPRAMGTCYDPGVEAALIARWPGRIEPGSVHDELLSGVDFAPTILEAAGEPIPDGMAGRSFHPLLVGGSYEPRERVFLEFTWHSKYNPMRAVRTERYKYVRNFGDLPRVYIPAPLFTAPSGLAVRDAFYGEERPREELYDLSADPDEAENLAGDPEHAEALAALRGQVEGWMEATDDRLLDGDWPPTDEQFERIRKSPWIPRGDAGQE